MKTALMPLPLRTGAPPALPTADEAALPTLFRSEAFAEDLNDATQPGRPSRVRAAAHETASRVPLLGLALTTFLGWFGR